MKDIMASVVIIPKEEGIRDKDYFDIMGVGLLLVVVMLLIFAFIVRKM